MSFFPCVSFVCQYMKAPKDVNGSIGRSQVRSVASNMPISYHPANSSKEKVCVLVCSPHVFKDGNNWAASVRVGSLGGAASGRLSFIQ
jgi:hypothetical protein